MDNLFEQMAQITKAHAYDIVLEENERLRREIETLRLKLKYSEELLGHYKDFVNEMRPKEVIETA